MLPQDLKVHVDEILVLKADNFQSFLSFLGTYCSDELKILCQNFELFAWEVTRSRSLIGLSLLYIFAIKHYNVKHNVVN